MTWTSRYSEKWPRLTALFHLDNGVDMEHNENGRYETQFQEPPAEPFYKFYLHPDDIGRGRSVSQYSMQDVGRSGTYRGGPKTSLCRMFLGTLLLFSLAGIVAVAVTLAVLLSQPHHRPYTTTKVDNETRFTEEYLAQKERILSKELCGLMKSMFKLESNRNDPVKKCSVALMIKDGHMKVNFLVPTSDDFIKEEIDKIKENVLKNILDMDAGLGVVSNAEDVNVSRKQIAKTTPRISTVEIIVTTMKPSISVTMTTPIRDINMKFTTVKFNIENSTLRTPEITTQNVNKSGTHETVTSQSTVTAKSFTKLDLVTPTLTSAGIQRNETMISLKTKNVTNDNFNETSEAGPTSVMPEITSSESTTTTQAEDTTPTIFTHTDLAKLFPLLSKKIDLSGLFLEPDYYTTSQNKKGGKSEMTTMSALSEFVPDWTNGGQKFGHPLVTTTEQTTKSYDENIMKNVDLFTTKKDDHSSHTHDHGDFGFGSNDTFDFGGLFLPSDKHSQESPLSFPDSHPTTSEYTDIDHFGHYDLSNFSFVSGIPDNITDELSTLDNVSPDKITTEANTATPFFNYDFGLDFSGMWSPDDPENTTTLPVTTTANNFKEGTQIEHKTDTFNTEHLETIRNVTDFPQLQNYTNAVTLKSTESMHFTEMTTGTPNAHLSLHNDTETGKEMNFNDFTFVSSIPVENQETTTTSMFAKSDFGMPFVDHEQSSNKSKHLMIDNDVMLESKDMMPTEINSSFAPNSRTIHIYPSVTTEASYYKSSRKEIIQVFSTDIRYASAYYALDSLTDSYQIQKAPQKSSISNLQGTWDDLKPIVYSTPYLPLEVSQPPMHTSPISTLKTEERNSMFSSISFSYQTESPGLEEESLKSEERLTSSASKLYQIDSPDFGKSNLKIQTRDISQSLVRISPISTLKTGEQFTSSTSVSYQTDSPVFDEKLESSFTGNMPKALKQPNSSFPSIAIRVSNHPKVLISSEDINILPTSSSVLYRPRESINQKPYSSQIYMSEFGLGDINGFFPDMSFPDHIMIDHSLLNGPEVSGKVRVSSAILPAFSSKSSEHSLLSNLQSQKPITTTSVPYNNLSFSGRISMQTRIRDMNKNPSATEIISQNFKNNDTIRDTEDFLLSNQFTFPNISDDYPSNIRFTNSSFEENLSATSAKASTSLSSSLFNVPSSSTVSENLKSSYISLGNENMSSVAIPKQISSSTHMNEWSSISSPLLSGSVKDFDSSNFNDLQLSIAFVSSTDASSAHLVTSPILSRTTDSPSVKGLHLQESVRLTPTKTVLSFENLKITFSTPSPQGFSSKTKNKSDNVFLDKSKQSRYIDTMLTSSEIQQSEGSSDKSSTVAISSDNSDSYLSPSLHTSIEFQKESTLATPFIKYTSVILPRMSKVENTASIHVPLTNNMTSLRASVLQSTINNTLIDMQSYKPSPSAIYSSTGTRQVIQNDTKVHQQENILDDYGLHSAVPFDSFDMFTDFHYLDNDETNFLNDAMVTSSPATSELKSVSSKLPMSSQVEQPGVFERHLEWDALDDLKTSNPSMDSRTSEVSRHEQKSRSHIRPSTYVDESTYATPYASSKEPVPFNNLAIESSSSFGSKMTTAIDKMSTVYASLSTNSEIPLVYTVSHQPIMYITIDTRPLSSSTDVSLIPTSSSVIEGTVLQSYNVMASRIPSTVSRNVSELAKAEDEFIAFTPSKRTTRSTRATSSVPSTTNGTTTTTGSRRITTTPTPDVTTYRPRLSSEQVAALRARLARLKEAKRTKRLNDMLRRSDTKNRFPLTRRIAGGNVASTSVGRGIGINSKRNRLRTTPSSRNFQDPRSRRRFNDARLLFPGFNANSQFNRAFFNNLRWNG